MTDLLKELKTLNTTLQRLADFYLPSLDPDIFDSFKAFRAYSRNNNLCVRGIPDHDHIRLQELRGIDQVVKELKKNTEQFLSGLPCNNVLLYGPRGTGKSSAIKALLNAYSKKGLRMIEMPRDTLFHILEIAEAVKDRPESFIIFCDDLSFEEEEKSYRQLKTILEGGLRQGQRICSSMPPQTEGISCLKCPATISQSFQEESSSLLRQWKRRCL